MESHLCELFVIGIFGMPVDVCATQYAHAVISASAKIEGSSLREIHFIDMSREVVVVMKQIFSSIFNASTSSIPEVSLSVGSSSLRPDMNPMGVLTLQTWIPEIRYDPEKEYRSSAISADQ